MTLNLLSRGAIAAALVSFSILTGCAENKSGPAGDSILGSSTSTSDALAGAINDDPIDTSRITLVVYGMSCPLCATNVDKQLLAIDGVSNVDVDLSSGNIDVALKDAPKPTTRQLAGAVERSGFTLMDIKKN